MKIFKMINVARSKNDEKWLHKIITSKNDLREWLTFEKNIYANHSGFSGGSICLSEQDYIWKYQKRLRYTEYYLNTGKILNILFQGYF